jgi:hypothetical protein
LDFEDGFLSSSFGASVFAADFLIDFAILDKTYIVKFQSLFDIAKNFFEIN